MENHRHVALPGTPARRVTFGLFALASMVAVTGYLAYSAIVYRPGYPLDDAWIHQTYARNLARSGEWSFLAGQRSAGSTAPLYTVLLSAGHLGILPPAWWTYFLGWLCLLCIAIAGYFIFMADATALPRAAIWAGIFLAFEWHLVWAAVSGMETLLFACLVLLTLLACASGRVNWTLIGILIGLSVWVRPDGITLLGPVALLNFAGDSSWREKLQAALKVSLSTLCMLAAYGLFNVWAGGSFFPNTFSAKQVEYSALQSIPLWERFAAQFGMLLVGGGFLLLPGFVYLVVDSMKKRSVMWLAWILWVVGYLLIFAWRLPVTYQHGRYAIPAMVVYFVLGAAGCAALLNRLGRDSACKRVLSSTWILTTATVSGIFYLMGAGAYAQDVAIIESEMVATASWIRQNTPPDALVAVHDVGAMGYFSERKLIDLAGLVSPEVIGIMRDEDKLREYLDERRADFLVVFPGWYDEIHACLPLVHSTGAAFSLKAGGENMAVYRWEEAGKTHNNCQN